MSVLFSWRTLGNLSSARNSKMIWNMFERQMHHPKLCHVWRGLPLVSFDELSLFSGPFPSFLFLIFGTGASHIRGPAHLYWHSLFTDSFFDDNRSRFLRVFFLSATRVLRSGGDWAFPWVHISLLTAVRCQKRSLKPRNCRHWNQHHKHWCETRSLSQCFHPRRVLTYENAHQMRILKGHLRVIHQISLNRLKLRRIDNRTANQKRNENSSN